MEEGSTRRTYSIHMLCSSLHSEHAEYSSATPDIQHCSASKQVLVVVHGISVGERTDLVFQHFFMDTWI